jgi:hypothetical protein
MDYSEDGKVWKTGCTATDVRAKAS